MRGGRAEEALYSVAKPLRLAAVEPHEVHAELHLELMRRERRHFDGPVLPAFQLQEARDGTGEAVVVFSISRHDDDPL